MTQKSSSQKITQHKTQDSDQASAAGPDGTAIAPPAYGIDFLDRGVAPVGSTSAIQRKASLSTGGDAAGTRPTNRIDLPDALKTGVESILGLALDDARMHYNSPAKYKAHAYKQGMETHAGPGKEKSVPHIAWHVIQQQQGQVKPAVQRKDRWINQHPTLEQEADQFGAIATKEQPESFNHATGLRQKAISSSESILQLFAAPPGVPPGNGVRGGALNASGVPTESHVTTRNGAANDLVGTAPGAVIINGWPYVLAVGASGPWVRFHLINQQIGGLGNQNNLAPTSHATNHQANWRRFEQSCQYHVGLQNSVHVTVDVTYPAPAIGAVAGTLQANQHFYPSQIDARLYLWDAVAGNYVLNANGAPANRNTYQVTIAPFPLQPPLAAGVTDLRNQTAGWVQNTLMGGGITLGQAQTFQSALLNPSPYMGDDVNYYVGVSQEPTPEMKLLDALDSFVAVELNLGIRVPAASRIQILNGSYRLV